MTVKNPISLLWKKKFANQHYLSHHRVLKDVLNFRVLHSFGLQDGWGRLLKKHCPTWFPKISQSLTQVWISQTCLSFNSSGVKSPRLALLICPMHLQWILKWQLNKALSYHACVDRRTNSQLRDELHRWCTHVPYLLTPSSNSWLLGSCFSPSRYVSKALSYSFMKNWTAPFLL